MNHLSFSGKMLLSGFSVYLFRISNGTDKFFYVGMTGDNHYPSARSAVHRFSGHFELQSRSTQNQLGRQLTKKGEAWIANSTIELFHWPIDGFKEWKGSYNEQYKKGLNKEEKAQYEAYKFIQKEVLALEKFVISELSKRLPEERLWNKMISSSNGCPKKFEHIAEEIISKVFEH